MNPNIDFPAECLALIGIENPSASGQGAPNCGQYVAPGQPKPGVRQPPSSGISPITERPVVAFLTALAIIGLAYLYCII
ncbi:hypothetical protein DdX_10188 [Ditylenchus destructor]|uniref:Uncharacterized protein n=1 Tax=Ditylenchus destructor TaxID=166010 RepID=A0AAD4N4H0_9BILA|nr:hypothetical protein DdX_10188 [Ditylenchus destructor]